eukprot:8408277-Alexandrium_andersonii.AAC.1
MEWQLVKQRSRAGRTTPGNAELAAEVLRNLFAGRGTGDAGNGRSGEAARQARWAEWRCTC